MENREEAVEMTPGQKRTANARIALMTKTAERHKEKHIAALELLGYTVIPPEKQQEND